MYIYKYITCSELAVYAMYKPRYKSNTELIDLFLLRERESDNIYIYIFA